MTVMTLVAASVAPVAAVLVAWLNHRRAVTVERWRTRQLLIMLIFASSEDRRRIVYGRFPDPPKEFANTDEDELSTG